MSDQPESGVLGPRKLCLVVDDSATVRRVAGRMLRELEIDVDEASDGQIALEKCLRLMPEVIVLDWNMPVLNGIEFLRSLRKLEDGEHPRVVFCTTNADVEHLREAFETGANDYIMKPFDALTLKSKVLKNIRSESNCTAGEILEAHR